MAVGTIIVIAVAIAAACLVSLFGWAIHKENQRHKVRMRQINAGILASTKDFSERVEQMRAMLQMLDEPYKPYEAPMYIISEEEFA